MASLSGMQYAKHKSVYGKKGGRGYQTSNLSSFFDDNEEDELASASNLGRKQGMKAAYAIQKTELKPQDRTSKLVKPKAKRQDTFDVPSSSDDEISSPPKPIAPINYKVRLAGDKASDNVPLAPWEKRRLEDSKETGAVKKRRTPEGSPEAQLKQELRRATLSPESNPGTPNRKDSEPLNTSMVNSPTSADLRGTSAAQRLAARRGLVDSSAPSSADERSIPARAVPKRAVGGKDESASTPRKRARMATRTETISDDVLMADSDDHESYGLQNQTSEQDDADVYDFPGTSDDEVKISKPVISSPKYATKPARRGKLGIQKSRSLHPKGSSAPSRLAEMIATDTDTTEPSTRSPSETPSLISPKHAPSTPPSARIGSPDTAVKAGTMTPKQARLWDDLLPSDPVVPSPSALAIKELTISRRRRPETSSAVRRLTKSQSDVPRQRLRMVDRLKASAPSSDIESGDEEIEDTDMAEGDETAQKPDATSNTTQAVEKAASQPSRSLSESQSQSAASKPSMRTYASVRSHLDDTIDDEIMFGLITESAQEFAPSQQALRKQTSTSQKSAFDLDDSDDDGGNRFRTIHELRASGAHTHSMWDIEEALQEIKHHGSSQRGRRRTALIDLVTKLSDKAFATRFVGQSCELRLAAECGACSDDIADFILAAGMSFILAAEPPEHTVQVLQDHGVLPWLTGLLDQDTAVSKMAKERRNNMSKASQASLGDFCDIIKTQSSLWSEDKPPVISPRLMALKALDQLARRLRRSGDKSELLQANELTKVLRDAEKTAQDTDQVELLLSISLLESLSTASLSLRWPDSIVRDVGSILTESKTTSPSLRHAQFLALRLCLNLTNDNKKNCSLLTHSSRSSVVPFLLRSIQDGYAQLATETDDEKRTIALDLLVLAIGIMINLAEHCNDARSLAVAEPELLGQLIEVFRQGQKHMLDAESVEESISNVTLGYLAVMLANLCQDPAAKEFIASKLPRQNLAMLIDAVEEFALHHQKVDTMNFDGEEGKEVWGAFTEKLKTVLTLLKKVEEGVAS